MARPSRAWLALIVAVSTIPKGVPFQLGRRLKPSVGGGRATGPSWPQPRPPPPPPPLPPPHAHPGEGGPGDAGGAAAPTPLSRLATEALVKILHGGSDPEKELKRTLRAAGLENDQVERPLRSHHVD